MSIDIYYVLNDVVAAAKFCQSYNSRYFVQHLRSSDTDYAYHCDRMFMQFADYVIKLEDGTSPRYIKNRRSASTDVDLEELFWVVVHAVEI